MAKYIDFDKLMEAIEKDIEPYKSWDCTKFDVVMDTILEAPIADVVEVKHTNLRVEIRTDCFKNQELAKEKGWYRKFFYCFNCGLNIRTETWDDHYMFGMGTVLKSNKTPKCCPECGAKIRGDAE